MDLIRSCTDVYNETFNPGPVTSPTAPQENGGAGAPLGGRRVGPTGGDGEVGAEEGGKVHRSGRRGTE